MSQGRQASARVPWLLQIIGLSVTTYTYYFGQTAGHALRTKGGTSTRINRFWPGRYLCTVEVRPSPEPPACGLPLLRRARSPSFQQTTCTTTMGPIWGMRPLFADAILHREDADRAKPEGNVSIAADCYGTEHRRRWLMTVEMGRVKGPGSRPCRSAARTGGIAQCWWFHLGLGSTPRCIPQRPTTCRLPPVQNRTAREAAKPLTLAFETDTYVPRNLSSPAAHRRSVAQIGSTSRS